MPDSLPPHPAEPGSNPDAPQSNVGRKAPGAGGITAGATTAKGKAAEGDDATAAANKLTPEEQMARFEKELKENDWGHQPC